MKNFDLGLSRDEIFETVRNLERLMQEHETRINMLEGRLGSAIENLSRKIDTLVSLRSWASGVSSALGTAIAFAAFQILHTQHLWGL